MIDRLLHRQEIRDFLFRTGRRGVGGPDATRWALYDGTRSTRRRDANRRPSRPRRRRGAEQDRPGDHVSESADRVDWAVGGVKAVRHPEEGAEVHGGAVQQQQLAHWTIMPSPLVRQTVSADPAVSCGSAHVVRIMSPAIRRLTAGPIPAVAAALSVATLGPATAADRWTTLPGYNAPGTPKKYDKVRVLKQGPASADNVLVLILAPRRGVELPTGGARSRPAPRVAGLSIERRENLLEDNTVLNKYVAGKRAAPSWWTTT